MESQSVVKAAYSLDEVCHYICVSRQNLYRLMDSGQIQSFHIGRKRLVLREALDAFLADRVAEASR